MLALVDRGVDSRVMSMKILTDLLEEFSTGLIALGSRRHDDVVLVVEQLGLERSFLIEMLVDFEPVRDVQRTQSHGEPPTPGVERHVGEVAR
jgi:hypothetical protein